MKKILLTAALSCAMILGLTACGGGSNQSAATDNNPATAASSSSASGDTAAAPSGETFDVGEYTVLVPDGWFAFAQTDTLAEPDEDGNYPLSTNSMGLIKGGKDNTDVYSKPTIYIYKNSSDAKSQAENTAIFYDETTDMDVTVNGTKCYAFEAKTASFSDESKKYVYDCVFIPAADDCCVQVTIPVDMVDFEGVNIDDADVQAILESITVK